LQRLMTEVPFREKETAMLKDPFNLSGKVAFVTGAGQGLGREFALALANAGAEIVIAELNPQTGPKVAREVQDLERKALAVVCDVTRPESIQQAADKAKAEFGKIDVLVNNAGVSIWCEAEAVSVQDWKKVIDVNLNGLFYCSQIIGRMMLEQGSGSIINIASMSGRIVNIPQCQASYNASKAAVIHLTKSLAIEWVKRGVRVNAISPGYMSGPLVDQFFEKPDIGGVWMDRIPMGRPGRPEELGPLAVYLASDGSSYVTGANFVIDGGYTAV